MCNNLATEVAFGFIPGIAVAIRCSEVVQGEVMHLQLGLVLQTTGFRFGAKQHGLHILCPHRYLIACGLPVFGFFHGLHIWLGHVCRVWPDSSFRV